MNTDSTSTSPDNFYLLERDITLVAAELRQELRSANLSCMELTISVSGRVHDGDLSIRFSLEGSYGDSVTGGTLRAVLSEYLRRRGWTARNAPLSLSYTNGTDA